MKKKALSKIATEISLCQKCPLARSRKKTVPGAGNENALIMMIGEAPGYHENEQGLPFVGNAGKLLAELLESINIKREDIFITNVIKCRPPANRDPLENEIQSCQSYLDKQIQIINPAMIVTLGRFSMRKFFGAKSISSIHGQPLVTSERIYFPIYHPAAALHQPNLKKSIFNDIAQIPPLLESYLQGQLKLSHPSQLKKTTNDSEQPTLF